MFRGDIKCRGSRNTLRAEERAWAGQALQHGGAATAWKAAMRYQRARPSPSFLLSQREPLPPTWGMLMVFLAERSLSCCGYLGE